MNQSPFFAPKAKKAINSVILESSLEDRSRLEIVSRFLDGHNIVLAGTKVLNRYGVLPGKVFAASPKSKKKYKVLRLVADDVVIQELSSQKVETFNINKLLKKWSEEGVQEISLLDDIINTVKSVIGPVLGVFLTTALVSWLTEKISR